MTRHQKKCHPQQEDDMEIDDHLSDAQDDCNRPESENEEEAPAPRDDTPDLLMTNVTTLQPGDSEAAEMGDEEPEEGARTKNMLKKEVLDEFDFSEEEKNCFTDTQLYNIIHLKSFTICISRRL